MFGRCRMRRGVSLEVIVEEDDSAEVSFDPSAPLMEEDDQDGDSETGTISSARSSPRDEEDDADDEERDREERDREERIPTAEERRRKRQGRTTGGLSRFRSVSCEALTLLDTSDMDSCCSEWDENDDLATSSNGNYVTLNRPISRRRIIQNIHSQCDSEDSGFEYHSNEDDHALEDHSSNEDHADDEEEEEEEEEDEGSEDRRDGREGDETAADFKSRGDERDDDEATITTESDDEEERSRIQMNEQGAVEGDVDNIARADEDKTVQTTKFAYSPNEALENDKIIIIETTTSVPANTQQKTQETADEEMQLKREAYTIRNKEVRLAELPRPDTVKSVKQLFENLKTPVHHFHAWRDLGRFRDIKSNPSSKILRFDRNDSKESLSSHYQFASMTLPRLPSQGDYPNIHHTSTKTKGKREADTKESTTIKSPQNDKGTPMSSILTQFIAQQKTKGEIQQDKLKNTNNSPPRLVKTQSGEKVVLRKPIVKGFNVKRALMENPRNFLPHDHNTSNQRQQQNYNHNKHNNSQKSIHVHRSHHHRDMTDRSDTESLASDISEDSGVSNDSLASTSSSSPFSYRALDAYASDPSFKWIDPSVMAKIRAVGTTVIFFGPRQRPRQDGTLPRGASSISSGLQVNRCSSINHGSQRSGSSGDRQQGKRSMPVPAPRIVGVVRKNSPSKPADTSQSSTDTKSLASPVPKDSQSENTSSPSINHFEEEKTPGKKGRWRSESDTVVYNFTKPQPPAVYF
ncbi:uncharacterized protein [Palaemon carinicauda]|uniref:uncharacterized protein n=1 Tax=Palaemon carinicauda TaxID=392227 RepID=UPI0035B62ACD